MKAIVLTAFSLLGLAVAPVSLDPVCPLASAPVGCGGVNDVTFTYIIGAGDRNGDCNPKKDCKVTGKVHMVAGGAATIVYGPSSQTSLAAGGVADDGPLNLSIVCGGKATWTMGTSGCKFEITCGSACVAPPAGDE